ncbi:hypothetical protein H6F93_00570 [Leptolyngbya sp. FACHB-671]|uniref:hypothetical protein n=1 Tax=Leptolyngbya sp. FACHB-671 TaxID=2692812 RepID=UPI00168753D0|nr:hypothetical protein [Leptolyngbya sp. FACHB-671]MBD2066044.1 hypothetical protein [Leptolyngbya sp. FACHB-671]
MIELFIVCSVATAILGAFAPVAVGSYKAERRRIESGEALENKLPPASPRANTPAPAFKPYSPTPQMTDQPIDRDQAPEPPMPALSRRDELWQRIAQHEDGWILDIMQRPILIWGAMGSYKSRFAAFLAALRIAYHGHIVEINDPHILLNREEAWKPLIDFGCQTFGSRRNGSEEEGFNYLSIARRIKAFVDRLKAATPNKNWYSPIFDEATQYADEPDIKEEASTLGTKLISDCRKAREAPILVAHGKTKALTGGSPGTYQAKEEGLVQLHLFSTSKNGEFYPLSKGELSGIPNEKGKFVTRQITLDKEWMSADYVFEYLGMSQTKNSTTQQIDDEDTILSSKQSQLAFLYSLPAETPQHEQQNEPQLSPQLQAVLDYAIKRGGTVTARDIQRGNLKDLIETDVNNAINVRGYMEELARLGRGRLEGEGSEQRFIVE